VNGEPVWDEEDEEKSSLDIPKPILPPSTITRIDLPHKRPGWLQKTERPVQVRVTSQDTNRFDYTWHRSSIECEGKEIAVVSIIDGWAEGDIYYAKQPEDFLSIDDAVFDMKIYSDEGDTYDTQRESFARLIANEIMSITGRYPLSDLIGGIRVTGIYPHEVRAIDIDLSEKVMKVTKTSGEILSLELLAA
jgi:hypothetical protein